MTEDVRIELCALPSDAHLHNFDEILPTLNTPCDSVYFASKNAFYKEGMRLFVT